VDLLTIEKKRFTEPEGRSEWQEFINLKNIFFFALQQGFVYYSKQKTQNILSKNP
jgi:hypothetical protein